MKCWSSEVGKKYTDRNTMTYKELDLLHKKWFGVTRTKINKDFFGKLNRSIKILEVGTNIGLELLGLQKMGFKNLYGIELQPYAVNVAQKTTKGLNIIQGSAFDIPFKDEFFDLVFTNGVLIHIAEKDIIRVMTEIYRCSKKYIWGFEYYADKYTMIPWQGGNNQMFKAPYLDFYLGNFPKLKLVKSQKYEYLEEPNTDEVFLLRK